MEDLTPSPKESQIEYKSIEIQDDTPPSSSGKDDPPKCTIRAKRAPKEDFNSFLDIAETFGPLHYPTKCWPTDTHWIVTFVTPKIATAAYDALTIIREVSLPYFEEENNSTQTNMVKSKKGWAIRISSSIHKSLPSALVLARLFKTSPTKVDLL